MKKDLVISLVILAGTIGLYASLSLMDEPAAASFPRVVILIMGCLGLILLVKTLAFKEKSEKPVLQGDRVANRHNVNKDASTSESFPFGRLIACFLLIVTYLAVMETLGFYISAFLFFIVLTFMLGRNDLTLRNGALRIGVAFIFTAILFVLFNVLLVVQTPKGLLF